MKTDNPEQGSQVNNIGRSVLYQDLLVKTPEGESVRDYRLLVKTPTMRIFFIKRKK